MLDRWLKPLHRGAEVVAAGLLAVIFVAFMVQVVLRYLLDWPVGWTIELSLAGWLWLRQRPARSYLVLVFPALSSYVLSLFFAQYGSGALVLFVSGLVIAGSAWLARFLAKWMPHPGDSPATIG